MNGLLLLAATFVLHGVTFTAAPPTVTALSPVNGPVVGGISVMITGTGFSGTTVVKFGSNAAPSFTVNSPTQITAQLPPGAAGTVAVIVTTPNGTSE